MSADRQPGLPGTAGERRRRPVWRRLLRIALIVVVLSIYPVRKAFEYAPSDDMLAVVLYLNQSTDRAGREQMTAFTRQVIDVCLRANGRFFLPYQVAYSREQLQRSYPQIREFLAARAEFDPGRMLTSTFVEKIEALLAR